MKSVKRIAGCLVLAVLALALTGCDVVVDYGLPYLYGRTVDVIYDSPYYYGGYDRGYYGNGYYDRGYYGNGYYDEVEIEIDD